MALLSTSRAGRGTSRATISVLAVLAASLLAQTVVTAQDFGPSFYEDRCPRPIGPDGKDRKCRCIRVRDYDDLRGAIKRMDDGECKCLEPFTVVKRPSDPPIEIDDMRRITVMCQQFGSCQIQGAGTHFVIQGDESEVTLAGFRLMGASQSAIVVREDTGTDQTQTREQIFCDIEFVGNQNDWLGGGAIFVGPRSRAYIKNSLFMQNAAQRMGGAIYSESSLLQVVASSFVANYASIGGAVSSNMPTAQLILADNEFDRNVAGLGPTYGPAIAANGHVQDFGGNEADPKDFMCLHCNLSAGARPQRPQLPTLPVYEADADPLEPGVQYVNIQRAKPGSIVDNGERTSTDRDVDMDFELNRYRRYEEYDEDYDMYPENVLMGPFNIKLYFGKGYQWQGKLDDLNMCLESKYKEQKVEGREEPLQLYECDDDQDRQRFVSVGKTIRIDEDRTLCMTYIDVRKIEMHKCTNSIYQQWDRIQADGKFRLSPVTDHRRCMTNHHHPRNEERIYLEWCEIAEEADTLYWEVKWMDGEAPRRITRTPTKKPTREPTTSPTEGPTKVPTTSPTDYPTSTPTLSPTFAPTISKQPTVPPSAGPTSSPTSSAPTFGPTVSKSPTQNPTNDPTSSPSKNPTAEPTAPPTRSPWDPNPDPQCGTQAGGGLCSQSLFCCSATGFCGLGSKYCGEGCQSGPHCANPVPAPAPGAEEVEEDEPDPVADDSVPEVEIVDEEVVDISPGGEGETAKAGHSFSVIGSGGVDSINDSSSSSNTVECGEQVEYIKNGVAKEKNCASNSFNADNLCHRQLASGNGRVWDVCCEQCEELKNAARL